MLFHTLEIHKQHNNEGASRQDVVVAQNIQAFQSPRIEDYSDERSASNKRAQQSLRRMHA